jgi:hypothetical protein
MRLKLRSPLPTSQLPKRDDAMAETTTSSMTPKPCAECGRLLDLYHASLQCHADSMSDYHLAVAAWSAPRIRDAKRIMRRTEEALETCRREILIHEATHSEEKLLTQI